jgi:hypothetical protein
MVLQHQRTLVLDMKTMEEELGSKPKKVDQLRCCEVDPDLESPNSEVS